MTPDRERELLEANNRYLDEARIARRAAAGGFQARVAPWLLACFGEAIARDRQERSHRFLEEAIELVQAAGCTASEAHQLVDYVFARPVGEMDQEIGGVMVTLAAFCLAHGHDMAEAGERELARVWTKIEKIRAKQAAKPKHSPLPEHVTDDTLDAMRDLFAERQRQKTVEGWTPEHDDEHDDGELARAASAYALNAGLPKRFETLARALRNEHGAIWPWHSDWWKPTDPRRDLVKAGALILAEIERLDRATASAEGRKPDRASSASADAPSGGQPPAGGETAVRTPR
nr:hypothetical protein [Mesorhizobium sp.]